MPDTLQVKGQAIETGHPIRLRPTHLPISRPKRNIASTHSSYTLLARCFDGSLQLANYNDNAAAHEGSMPRATECESGPLFCLLNKQQRARTDAVQLL